MLVFLFANGMLCNLPLNFVKLFCWCIRHGPLPIKGTKHMLVSPPIGQNKWLNITHLSAICLNVPITAWCFVIMTWGWRLVERWCGRVIMGWRNVRGCRCMNSRKWWRNRFGRMGWWRDILLMIVMWSSENLMGNEGIPWNVLLLKLVHNYHLDKWMMEKALHFLMVVSLLHYIGHFINATEEIIGYV